MRKCCIEEINEVAQLQHAKLLEDQEPETRIHGWTTLTKKFGPDLPLLSQPKLNLVHFSLKI